MRVGEIFEIKTSIGLAYVQYTHEHPMYGSLIRVFDDVYETRPGDLQALAASRERFVVFLPLVAAAEHSLVTLSGTADIPARSRPFPIFRAGRRGNWWLWDGNREWRIGAELPPEQRTLPMREIWNMTVLVSQIETGWRPENAAS